MTRMAHDEFDAEACGSTIPSDSGPVVKSALMVARVAIGALFMFSGAAKLGWIPNFGDPTGFASAIVKFEVIHADLVPLATFVIPWLEVIAGFFLALGLMTRGAAAALSGLLIVFTAAIISVMIRGMEIDCSCFGGAIEDRFGPAIGEWLEPKVGYKSITRNAVLFLLTVCIATLGPGYLAIDQFIHGKSSRRDHE